MKPVIQTVTESGRGNCLAACLASILEVAIEEVPDLDGGRNWTGLRSFLLERGMLPVKVINGQLHRSWVGYDPEHVILIGPSPRSSQCLHAVVAKPDGYGFEIVFDPYPEGGGLAGDPQSVIYLAAAEPTKPKAPVIESYARMGLRYCFWMFVHNALIHPLISLPWQPSFLLRWHDLSAKRCPGGG